MSAKFNWTMNQGETTVLTYTRFESNGTTPDPFDDSPSATFKGQARTDYGGDLILDMPNSYFALNPDGAGGTAGDHIFRVTVPASVTAGITAPGKYVYDIEITENPGQADEKITRVLEGTLIVTPEVTTS
tara:strand:- start:352 stop:741 length:390 start_codon:yes stop_codon:yes gene_type:complete